MADLAKQIAAVEQNINSNIPRTSSYVQPVASTAGSSWVHWPQLVAHLNFFEAHHPNFEPLILYWLSSMGQAASHIY